MQKALEICSEPDQVETNRSRVTGRALCWIAVDDVLYLSEKAHGNEIPFVVKRIQVYDREVDKIGPAWACRLTLEGDRLELLETVKYLYSKEPAGAQQ